MRIFHLFLALIWLIGCAHQAAITSRRLASVPMAPASSFDACRKDMPMAAESVCAKAGAGYVDCREDYANISPSTCLQANAGFADCRKDYLNLSVATCLKADGEYQSCRTKSTAAECLGMNMGER